MSQRLCASSRERQRENEKKTRACVRRFYSRVTEMNAAALGVYIRGGGMSLWIIDTTPRDPVQAVTVLASCWLQYTWLARELAATSTPVHLKGLYVTVCGNSNHCIIIIGHVWADGSVAWKIRPSTCLLVAATSLWMILWRLFNAAGLWISLWRTGVRFSVTH